MFTPQHPQGDRQDLVAVAVEIIGDRPQNDTAAIGGIDLLLLASTAMDAAVGALANNDTIADAPGRLNHRFGGEGGGVVERSYEYLASSLGREKFRECASGAN